MYRPCLHCENKKYDPECCPEICTYGEDRKRLSEFEKNEAEVNSKCVNLNNKGSDSEHICKECRNCNTEQEIFHGRTEHHCRRLGIDVNAYFGCIYFDKK